MMSAVTLAHVDGLAQALPEHDQQLLIDRISERLAVQQGYFTRADAFLKACKENPVRPVVAMDAGEDVAIMRDERGGQ